MDNMSNDEIFRKVGQIVCWSVAITIGLVVFFTMAGVIIAFASTGIGAIILSIVAWKLYKKYYMEE